MYNYYVMYAYVYINMYEGKMKSSSQACIQRETRDKRPLVETRRGAGVTSTLV